MPDYSEGRCWWIAPEGEELGARSDHVMIGLVGKTNPQQAGGDGREDYD